MRSAKDGLVALLPFLLALGCAHSPSRRPAAPVPRPAPAPQAQAPRREPSPIAVASADGPQLPALPGPTTPTDPPSSPNPLRRLYDRATRDHAGVECYTCRLTRREQINGKSRGEEVIRFQFRKQPWSVRFAWLDGEGKGREVIYVKDQHDNKLHTLLAAGDVPLMPAGKRMALAPDSVLVRSASRRGVTEAGLGNALVRFGLLVEAAEKEESRAALLRYVGPQTRPDYETPLEIVEQTIPPGAEKELPRGGRRWWGFDPTNRHLPVLVVTHDDRGQEVEYYRHDRFFFHRLGDDEFNPDRQWVKR